MTELREGGSIISAMFTGRKVFDQASVGTSLAQNLRPETRRLSPKLAKPLPTLGLDPLYADLGRGASAPNAEGPCPLLQRDASLSSPRSADRKGHTRSTEPFRTVWMRDGIELRDLFLGPELTSACHGFCRLIKCVACRSCSFCPTSRQPCGSRTLWRRIGRRYTFEDNPKPDRRSHHPDQHNVRCRRRGRRNVALHWQTPATEDGH